MSTVDDTSSIVLSRGHIAVVSQADFPFLSARRWSSQVNPDSGRVYARASIGGKLFYMHRHIVDVFGGGLVKGLVVHHKDGNGLNNTRRNLVQCSLSVNSHDCSRFSGFAYRGVRRSPSGRYRARIYKDDKEIALGTFDKAEEAARAYDVAALFYYGPFAWTNFERPVDSVGIVVDIPF